MDAPEVLEVIHEMPYLESLIAALYNCQYGTLFTSLGISLSSFSDLKKRKKEKSLMIFGSKS